MASHDPELIPKALLASSFLIVLQLLGVDELDCSQKIAAVSAAIALPGSIWLVIADPSTIKAGSAHVIPYFVSVSAPFIAIGSSLWHLTPWACGAFIVASIAFYAHLKIRGDFR